jgi:heme-degrading monooxygenase HmoA
MSTIARVWFGKTAASKIDEYLEYVKETGVKALRKTPGNRGVLVFKRVDGNRAEIGVLSFWESRKAIEAFAGKDINKAVYYPQDTEYLEKLEPELVHYEVAVEDLGDGVRR